MAENKRSVFAGLLQDNTVFSSLMVISPVIMCGDTLKNAWAIMYAFSAITFISVIICSFVPRRIPYALRIIIYAAVASLIFIPVKMLAQETYPGIVTRAGIYFPLLAVNSLIVFRSESKFFKMKRGRMISSLAFYIIGFDAAVFITAFIRELLAYGTVNDRVVNYDILISGIGMPFGGFIVLGILCGIYRFLRNSLSDGSGSEELLADCDKRRDSNVSDN